ncbi:nif-specific transcriptional activator NifA [Vitreoscilla filiformis]|jgi:Nif-specific regulatory protein|uniref:Nif-specific regulatory protein n=1 Tax=Vitreoscilla filiformis TaxID=63 RepID=A0A221KEF7_VITFI|nr:nif-specific transcriptional activator NifA [Vitreoscilla filiformis]ASM77422.1 nif-specific transcriptional activator NifA [Vitreoscilla filiformis]
MIHPIHQERSHLELSTIYEVCRILGDSLDISRTFRAALNVLAAQLGLTRAMIVFGDEEGTLKVHSAVGLSRDQEQRGRWHSGEGVIGRVHLSGLPVVVPNVSGSDEFIDRTGAFGPQEGKRLAFLVFPLKADQQTLGVLAAQREVEGVARLSDDQRILTMVATLLAQSFALHRAVSEEHQRLQLETTRLQKALTRENITRRYSIDNVVGQSRRMQQVFAEVHQAAPSRSTVLLRGESGTGKEEVARAIHYLSPRKDGPFIKVNCAALTESLLESELFGHEKGAFTGAVGDRKGRFELANGGTLFLDEVGDISPAFQAKLLRVLQEREFERVGGTRPVKVDVRLICATNRDLERMVQRGEYRADLYYRINVVSIFLPPLRERRDDIPLLVAHFIDRFNKENRRELKVTPEAMQVLANCYWPGNVRELQNCIERTATMVQSSVIRDLAFPCRSNRCLTQTLHHIDKEDAVAPANATSVIHFAGRVNPAPTPVPAPAPPPAAPMWGEEEEDDDDVVRIGPTERLGDASVLPARQFGNEPPSGERERLIWAMEQCGWVQAKAARLLKVTPRQLGYALQKHRIEVRKL